MSLKKKIWIIAIALALWLIWFLIGARGPGSTAIIAFGIIGLYVWSIIWVYEDAVARGKPGVLVAILVAFMVWPLSLALWLVIRPETN